MRKINLFIRNLRSHWTTSKRRHQLYLSNLLKSFRKISHTPSINERPNRARIPLESRQTTAPLARATPPIFPGHYARAHSIDAPRILNRALMPKKGKKKTTTREENPPRPSSLGCSYEITGAGCSINLPFLPSVFYFDRARAELSSSAQLPRVQYRARAAIMQLARPFSQSRLAPCTHCTRGVSVYKYCARFCGARRSRRKGGVLFLLVRSRLRARYCGERDFCFCKFNAVLVRAVGVFVREVGFGGVYGIFWEVFWWFVWMFTFLREFDYQWRWGWFFVRFELLIVRRRFYRVTFLRVLFFKVKCAKKLWSFARFSAMQIRQSRRFSIYGYDWANVTRTIINGDTGGFEWPEACEWLIHLHVLYGFDIQSTWLNWNFVDKIFLDIISVLNTWWSSVKN